MQMSRTTRFLIWTSLSHCLLLWLIYCAGTLIWIFFMCPVSFCLPWEHLFLRRTGKKTWNWFIFSWPSIFIDFLIKLSIPQIYMCNFSIRCRCKPEPKTNLTNCWIYFWWWYISPVSGTKFWTDIGNWSLYLSFSYSMSNWFKAQGNIWNHLQLINESIPSNFYALLLICWLILESFTTTNLREQSEYRWGTDTGWEMQNWPTSFRESNGYLTVFKVRCENSFTLVLVKMI